MSGPILKTCLFVVFVLSLGAVGLAENDDAEAQQIEALLQAVRQAQKPAADMSVHVVYTRNAKTGAGKYPGIGASDYQEDISVITSGIRSRMDCQIKHYQDDSQEWQTTSSELSVYNGHHFRKLRTRFRSELSQKYQGSQGIKDNTAGVFSRRIAGLPFDLNNQKALSTFTLELQPSPAPGIYILDAIRRGVRRRLTIDGNKGFNVTKLQALLPNGSISYETNFKLREYGEIWYPYEYSRVRHGVGNSGKPSLECKTEFKNVKFNIAVDDDMFELEYPSGTQLFDSVIQDYIIVGAPMDPTLDSDPSLDPPHDEDQSKSDADPGIRNPITAPKSEIEAELPKMHEPSAVNKEPTGGASLSKLWASLAHFRWALPVVVVFVLVLLFLRKSRS